MTIDHRKPEKECPRWQSCSVNNCPLSVNRAPAFKGDKQRKCPMERAVRQKIARKYPDLLPEGGLTSRERQGDKIWASFDAAKRQLMQDKGKLALEAYKNDSKGKTTKPNQE